MILLDANVPLEIVRARPKTKHVRRLMKRADEVAVADWAIAEALSGLSQQLRERKITRPDAERAITALDGWVTRWRRIEIHPEDVGEVARLLRGLDLNLRAPDALHVVIADSLDATLATLDGKLASAAEALGLTVVRP